MAVAAFEMYLDDLRLQVLNVALDASEIAAKFLQNVAVHFKGGHGHHVPEAGTKRRTLLREPRHLVGPNFVATRLRVCFDDARDAHCLNEKERGGVRRAITVFKHTEFDEAVAIVGLALRRR